MLNTVVRATTVANLTDERENVTSPHNPRARQSRDKAIGASHSLQQTVYLRTSRRSFLARRAKHRGADQDAHGIRVGLDEPLKRDSDLPGETYLRNAVKVRQIDKVTQARVIRCTNERPRAGPGMPLVIVDRVVDPRLARAPQRRAKVRPARVEKRTQNEDSATVRPHRRWTPGSRFGYADAV